MKSDAESAFVSHQVFFFQQLVQVPGYCLAFSIGVGCQIERIGLAQFFLDRIDVLFIAFDNAVIHFEVVVGFNRAFFRDQVAHVTIGG